MIGIDTIGLRLTNFPFDKVIQENWHQSITNVGEENEEETWSFEITYCQDTIIKCIYRLRDKAGKQSLFIYISSVARMAFGNNYTPFPDVDSAIKVVEESLAKIPKIPKIENLRYARLFRLDVFCHYYLGIENMENNLGIINRTNYPHRTRGPYLNDKNETYDAASNNGVSFSTPSKTKKSIFYDKYVQCEDPKTIGYLRHEIQLSYARAIEDEFGISKPVFGSIDEKTIDKLLAADLGILKLDKPIVNKNNSETLLKKMYGTKTGCNLYCLMLYLAQHQTLDIKEMAKSLGIGHDTLQIKLKMITKAGISPYLLDEDTVLSPLSEKRSLIFGN